MEQKGIEDTQTHFLHPTPKYPADPKYPALSIPLNTQLGKNPLALGHGTAWDHYKMENFPQKYQAWNLFVDIPWFLGHGTAWDHYKMENYLHPTQKNTQLPQNTQLRRYQSFCQHPLAFGTWDSMGPMENYQKISFGLCVSIPWLWDVPG
jgi:hypothetical protein